MKISVVIATYNRLPLLLDLLADLEHQTLSPGDFDVVVVDDGSREPVAPHLARLQVPYTLITRAQANAGPAVARHYGATAASGDILVFLDDDMSVAPDFLEQHLRAHEQGATLVQGHIAPPPALDGLPLFERFHAYQLERFARALEAGRERFHGIYVCTGNVSVRRLDYLAAGGFDAELGRSEDRELGIRLEKAGAKLAFSTAAASRHRSDHDSLEVWMRRAFLYGTYDLRIARKHPDVTLADPWRFLFLVNPISRPLLLGAVLAPDLGSRLARIAFAVAAGIDRGPGRRAALAGATLAYGLQYFTGMRDEYGSLRAALAGLGEYALGKHGKDGDPASVDPTSSSALARFVAAVREDYAALVRVRAKYNADVIPFYHLPIDAARKIGFQMMVAVRAMRLARDSGVPLLAQILSRAIRHLYGAEVHWDAELAPGVVVIHGNGLVISHAARVGEDCILFHNVTLGEGRDPETLAVGAPTLGRNVHVGPGSTLLGPITIGDDSKIMAGSVVTRSVPARSLVQPSEAVVQPRDPSAGAGRKVVRRRREVETEPQAAGET